MKDKKEQDLFEFLTSVYIFFTTIIVIGFASYIIRGEGTESVRNSILGILMTGMLLFAFEYSKKRDDFSYHNREHLFRICLSYTVGLLASVGGALAPAFMFPLLSFGLVFFFMTNLSIGISAYFLFCMNITLLSGAGIEVFFFYFITGFVAMIICQERKYDYHVVFPVAIVTMLSIVSITALYILRFYKITPDMIINPSVGIVSNAVILLISLHIIGKKIVHPFEDKYIEINDPEYNLLAQLKEHDKAQYYHAIHTAYLSDRIAGKLDLNRKLSKGGGYYHKIGILRDTDYITVNKEIALEYRFPSDLTQLINEIESPGTFPKHKEALVVMMADSVVSSISFLIQKDPSMKIDYSQVIDVVFDKKMESGILKNSKMEFREYYLMKQYFKEEELYYDFLR